MTDPDRHEALARIAADNMATSFIVEILLARYLSAFPPEERAEVVASLKRTAAVTKDFGTDDNAHLQVLLSDAAVLLPQKLSELIDRALSRLK